MRKDIQIEFKIQELLREVDWEGKYPDVKKTDLDIKTIIADLNAELKRQEHNRNVPYKDNQKRSLKKPLYGTGAKDKDKDTRSGIFYSEGGEVDVEKLKKNITKRPSKIFKQNEKAKRTTDGGLVMTVNTGIPAIWGTIYDEDANRFVYVNTCPGAGACQINCYALKSGYMYDHAVLKATRTLNFMMNDPEGYEKQAESELEKIASNLGDDVSLEVRWNDSGDFFSKTYFQIAKNVTKNLIEKGYNIKSYAYTKMGDLMSMENDEDFKMVFSTNANPKNRTQIDFKKSRFSHMVPYEVFRAGIFSRWNKNLGRNTAHIEMDENGKPVWLNPDSREELRQRIFDKYNEEFDLDISKLVYQDELPTQRGEKNEYVAIMIPRDPDIAPQRSDVRGVFILEH